MVAHPEATLNCPGAAACTIAPRRSGMLTTGARDRVSRTDRMTAARSGSALFALLLLAGPARGATGSPTGPATPPSPAGAAAASAPAPAATVAAEPALVILVRHAEKGDAPPED